MVFRYGVKEEEGRVRRNERGYRDVKQKGGSEEGLIVGLI